MTLHKTKKLKNHFLKSNNNMTQVVDFYFRKKLLKQEFEKNCKKINFKVL